MRKIKMFFVACLSGAMMMTGGVCYAKNIVGSSFDMTTSTGDHIWGSSQFQYQTPTNTGARSSCTTSVSAGHAQLSVTGSSVHSYYDYHLDANGNYIGLRTNTQRGGGLTGFTGQHPYVNGLYSSLTPNSTYLEISVEGSFTVQLPHGTLPFDTIIPYAQ